MINRYEIKEITEIWSDKQKYDNWLEIEILNCEALNKLKIISNKELEEIKKNITYKIKDIEKLELETKHDVIAFTRAISLNMNSDSKKWIHYGLTSTDIVDTANAISFKKVNKIILNELLELKKELIKIAKKHKYSYQIGRTHGMHAEVTTFGIKILGWVDELNRHIKRFKIAADEVQTAKISGAVGTYANTPPFVQNYICKKLGVNSAKFSTQVISRDIHSFYFDVINNIGLSINKFATELRHLHRTEVGEISEFFSKNQKGSSAMPHKKNPISLENVCGLSRLLSGYSLTANENVNLWHERDISHSSTERVIFLDATTTIVYILRRFKNIVKTMIIDKKRMIKNIELSESKIYSGQIMSYLIKNTNLSREVVYDKIQSIILKCNNEKLSFIGELKKDDFFKDFKKLDDILSLKNNIKHIDRIYEDVLNQKV